MARDWLKTLWLASYKGAAFWVERDEEEGGRRIVVHKFPMRDDPYLEDLGEDQRDFEVTAYLASDRADGDAGQLIAICATRGPGILVLPTHGPQFVRCLNWKRSRDKDRHGYIAITLKCVREGSAFAVVSIAMGANQIFTAADNIAAVVSALFAAGLKVAGQPDYVAAAATGAAQDAVSALEAVRTTEPVAAEASAKQRNVIEAIFDQIPLALEAPDTAGDVAAQIVEVARALGDAIPPASALRAFDAIVVDAAFANVLVPGAVYVTLGRRAMALNTEQVFRVLRLAALTAYCEAVARVALTDRGQGITLRANVAEYFEAQIEDLDAAEFDLVLAIGALRDATIAYLSSAIIDLAPVIKLESNLSMPSLFWAYRLYQDPARAMDIVARNRVVHPSFMPVAFEALAK